MHDVHDPSKRMRVRKTGRGMTEGLVYVEAYLPFDVEAFAEFAHKLKTAGSAVAVQKADPDLAERALVPIDTHGEAMLQEDVIALAHAFVLQSRKIDVMHDGQVRNGVQVVQTFVNTPEIASPHFWPGAWVTVLKIDPGSPEWAEVESGALDAVSFQGFVSKVPITVAAESR